MLKEDDLVKAFGLLNATELNGKIGRIVMVPKEGTTGGRAGVRFVDHMKAKSIKVENLEPVDLERHFHFEDKDIPGMGYISPRDGSTIQIRIENGKDKNCVECGVDLENQYHVLHDDQWLCEEDFVRKCFGYPHPLFRSCALCQKYIPFQQAKALPRSVMNEIYPDGKLPNGQKVGYATETNSDEMMFWAHRECFTCHLCGDPMYISEMNSDGFIVKIQQNVGEPHLIFLCNAPPGAGETSHCSNRYESVKKARKWLGDIEALSVEELRTILTERDIPLDEEEEKHSLVKKVVVTDKKREQKVAHIVTQHARSSTKPGAFATHGCAGGICDCKASIVGSRASPGADLIDLRCHHGCPQSLVCWDDPERAWKRSIISDFMEHAFPLFHMTDQQCQASFPGCPVSSFQNACNMTGCFWFTDGKKALLADCEECFIPKLMWSVATSSCCKEDGGYNYHSAAVATSLITSQMLDMFRNNETSVTMEDVRLMLSFGKLSRQLKEIESGPKNLYNFMNSPEQRRCDCMQYVATAASIGTLRLKKSGVKDVKHRCAFCQAYLALPKFCSQCKEVAYCGDYHLSQHWKIHKKECIKGKKIYKCAVCQIELDQPMVCSLCKEVTYCGKEHSAKHWKVHKKVCKGRKGRKKKN